MSRNFLIISARTRKCLRPCWPLVLVVAAACAATAPAPTPEAGLAAATAALGRGDLDATRNHLEQAARDPAAGEPARAAAWAGLGVALAREERWEEAAAAFEASLALVPGQAPVRFNLGVAYRHLGWYTAARDSYLQAAALAPGDMDILYNLGILYELYLNQPEQALAAYARYVEGGGRQANRVRRWIEAIEGRQRGQGGTEP